MWDNQLLNALFPIGSKDDDDDGLCVVSDENLSQTQCKLGLTHEETERSEHEPLLIGLNCSASALHQTSQQASQPTTTTETDKDEPEDNARILTTPRRRLRKDCTTRQSVSSDDECRHRTRKADECVFWTTPGDTQPHGASPIVLIRSETKATTTTGDTKAFANGEDQTGDMVYSSTTYTPNMPPVVWMLEADARGIGSNSSMLPITSSDWVASCHQHFLNSVHMPKSKTAPSSNSVSSIPTKSSMASPLTIFDMVEIMVTCPMFAKFCNDELGKRWATLVGTTDDSTAMTKGGEYCRLQQIQSLAAAKHLSLPFINFNRRLGVHAGITLYNMHRVIAYSCDYDEAAAEDLLHIWKFPSVKYQYANGRGFRDESRKAKHILTDKTIALTDLLPPDCGPGYHFEYILGTVMYLCTVTDVLRGHTAQQDLLWVPRLCDGSCGDPPPLFLLCLPPICTTLKIPNEAISAQRARIKASLKGQRPTSNQSTESNADCGHRNPVSQFNARTISSEGADNSMKGDHCNHNTDHWHQIEAAPSNSGTSGSSTASNNITSSFGVLVPTFETKFPVMSSLIQSLGPKMRGPTFQEVIHMTVACLAGGELPPLNIDRINRTLSETRFGKNLAVSRKSKRTRIHSIKVDSAKFTQFRLPLRRFFGDTHSNGGTASISNMGSKESHSGDMMLKNSWESGKVGAKASRRKRKRKDDCKQIVERDGKWMRLGTSSPDPMGPIRFIHPYDGQHHPCLPDPIESLPLDMSGRGISSLGEDEALVKEEDLDRSGGSCTTSTVATTGGLDFLSECEDSGQPFAEIVTKHYETLNDERHTGTREECS